MVCGTLLAAALPVTKQNTIFYVYGLPPTFGYTNPFRLMNTCFTEQNFENYTMFQMFQGLLYFTNNVSLHMQESFLKDCEPNV